MTLARTLNNAFGARSAPRGPRPAKGSKLEATLRSHPRVQHLDREDDGWFVTLHAGWRDGDDPYAFAHCRGTQTLSEALAFVRAAKPCDCDQCSAEKK